MSRTYPRLPFVPPLRRRGAALLAAPILLAAAAPLGCGTGGSRHEAIYGPSATVLEVVAVLRRHVPDDTYRFPPATDFTGRNVYRSSLLRLENLERMHADSLRSGHMDAVIAFAKARALERLRAYDLAAQQYREAARHETTLREEALRGASVCTVLHEATSTGIDLVDPFAAESEATLPADDEAVVAALDERVARLSQLGEEQAGSHYEAIVREEIERADVTRARYFVEMRFALPGGHVRAVSELQRVVARHGASKYRRRHLIALADLYAALAREYVAANPPESLRFDPPAFQELVDGASHLYNAVATQDGTPEKLEAARRLEALLAFTLRVDRDRFTP
jgi:hypothetical protein